MAEGQTREEYERDEDIAIKARRLDRHPEGNETHVLVRDGNGQWGTGILFDGDIMDDGDEEIDREDVIWFVDEATARRDFSMDPTLITEGCDGCGRDVAAEDTWTHPNGAAWCRACRACGADVDAPAFPEVRR